MDADVQKQIDICNIPEWLNAGYGRNVVGFICDTDRNGHRERTKSKVPMLNPYLQNYSGGLELLINNGKVVEEKIRCVETGETMNFDDFIKKYKVELINVSTDGGNADPNSIKAVWMREKIKKHNLLVTLSLGNANGKPSDNPYYGAGMLINGGVIENGSIRWGYYGQDPLCDFIMPTCGDTGTSFAAPSLYAMNGFLRTRYPKISEDDAREYWISNCIAKGKDKTKYGYGMPILGRTEGEFVQIIKKDFKVNNKIVQAKAVLVDGENYVRVRDFEDVFHVVDVEYDPVNKIPVIKD